MQGTVCVLVLSRTANAWQESVGVCLCVRACVPTPMYVRASSHTLMLSTGLYAACWVVG